MELYAPGARVAHVEYGDGTVTRADEFHTIVDFDAHGVRMFSSPRVVLKSSAVPAPIKVRQAQAGRAEDGDGEMRVHLVNPSDTSLRCGGDHAAMAVRARRGDAR